MCIRDRSGKYLLIVESPTKAKTIKKYLGDKYEVLSSVGHIKDLPSSRLAVDIEHDFKPEFIVPRKTGKAAIILSLIHIYYMLVDSVIVIQERTSVYIVKQLVAKQRIIVMICCSCVVENGISVFVKDGLTVFSLLRFFHIYGSAEMCIRDRQ